MISVRREPAVTCFLSAALLMLLVSRYLLRRVRARLGPATRASVEETARIQPMRFSKRVQRFSGRLLETMATQLGYTSESVGLVILEGTVDPNLTNDGELATIRPV